MVDLDRKFRGFGIPDQNWFKMPNEWTNVTAGMRSWAEQKVVEYVLRHTWGFHEYGQLKRISLDEFEHGRKRRDGSRLDQGVGLGRQAIINGLKQAVEDGFLIVETDAQDAGRVRKSYGLKIADSSRGYDDHTPGVRRSYSSSTQVTPRSEKETRERNSTVTNGGKSPVTQLPDLDQPANKTEYVADQILERLGDDQSRRFYELVAAKVPSDFVFHVLSEIESDGGARSPAKVFTKRINDYALSTLRRGIGRVD